MEKTQCLRQYNPCRMNKSWSFVYLKSACKVYYLPLNLLAYKICITWVYSTKVRPLPPKSCLKAQNLRAFASLLYKKMRWKQNMIEDRVGRSSTTLHVGPSIEYKFEFSFVAEGQILYTSNFFFIKSI